MGLSDASDNLRFGPDRPDHGQADDQNLEDSTDSDSDLSSCSVANKRYSQHAAFRGPYAGSLRSFYLRSVDIQQTQNRDLS